MRTRSFLVPALLLATAGLFGAWLLMRMPDEPDGRSDEPGPEPEVTAPPVAPLVKRPLPQAAPARKAPKATPPPPASPPAPVVHGPHIPASPASPRASQVELPAPERILRLPPHLENADPAEQRKYYQQLVRYQENVLERARETYQDTLDQAANETERQRARGAKRYLDQAESQLTVLREHLESIPERP